MREASRYFSGNFAATIEFAVVLSEREREREREPQSAEQTGANRSYREAPLRAYRYLSREPRARVHNRPFVNLLLARNVEERFDHPLITQNPVPRVSRTRASHRVTVVATPNHLL